MTWTKIAFRNLLRNKRRSLITVAAVALGFSAVNVFGGFTSYMFTSLRDSFIHAAANGHLQVYKKGFRERGSIEPQKYFLTGDEFSLIKEVAGADERIEITAGRMRLTGFMNYDEIQSIFIADAMVPSEKQAIYERAEKLDVSKKRYTGEALADEAPDGIGISYGLAEAFKLEEGSLVILTAPTLDGQMEALDAEVRQVSQNLEQSAADRFILLTLEWAQELYHTDGAGTVCLLLHDREEIEAVRASLEQSLAAKGIEVEIQSWDELSPMYTLSKNMFDVIFGVVFAILILIVSMSVMNTIGMAVMERTSEIGTLRSMGLKRRGVIKLFSIESGFLGMIGCVIGLVITVGVSILVEWLRPQWTPPMVGFKVRWQILLVPEYLIVTFVFLALLTMAAAILPARRAARASIVDALGHT